MNYRFKINKSTLKNLMKQVIRFCLILIIFLFVFMGAWCLPPKMIEKMFDSLNPKSRSENIINDDKEEEV
ncbi:MAG: hypothetical protein ACE5HX_01220 [bacterium]